MDQAVQIIGLSIMCIGLTGSLVGVVGILRWYAKNYDGSDTGEGPTSHG